MEEKKIDMAREGRTVSRREYLGRSAAVLALLLFVLVILNVVFSQVTTARWDLTSDGQFTLSPATVGLLDGLDSAVRIKVFLSKDLPAPDNTLEQRLRDLLNEFEASAHGKLSFEIIQPESRTDEEVAKGFGLRKVAVSQRDESQRSLRFVFKGLTVFYQDRAETIAELRPDDNLEYLLAKSIVNVVSDERKSVSVLTGFGGLAESPILRESMEAVFSEVFGSRVVVETSAVDEHCRLSFRPDALVVMNVTETLSPCALYAVEQAMFKGTSLFVLQSPTYEDYRQPDQPRVNVDSKLNDLLSGVGVRIESTVLLDRSHNLVGTQFTEDNQVPVSLPALPVLTSLDKSHPVTQNLTALVFPFSGTLALEREKISSHGAQLSILVRSSSESVARPSGGDIQVDALQNPRHDERPGPHVVAVTLQTPQHSIYTNQLPENADPADFVPSSDHVRYMIVPDGEFLFTNKIIGYTDEFARLGVHLFVNGIEWLIQDEALMEIRNRALPQMIRLPDKDTQSRMIWLNVLGVPALVIICMICLRLYRRHREKRIERKYKAMKIE